MAVVHTSLCILPVSSLPLSGEAPLEAVRRGCLFPFSLWTSSPAQTAGEVPSATALVVVH